MVFVLKLFGSFMISDSQLQKIEKNVTLVYIVYKNE